jgi:hypothetical protein
LAKGVRGEAKAAQLRGELVEIAEVESFWRGKLRALPNRILAVPSRVRDLSGRQSATMTRELSGALDELASNSKTGG